MFVEKYTPETAEYIEKMMDLFSDYELKHISEDELEEKLKELQKTIQHR